MKSVFDFLIKLGQNNNRDWFLANKHLYESAHKNVISLADQILLEMNSHDLIETVSGKKSLHRIYRDVRFSKDKTPYKTNWSGGLKRATAQRRGGYYYHLEPSCSYLAGGFWGPNKEDLKLIRDHLSQEPDDYKSVIGSAEFKKTFGEVLGEQLKTSPKGFESDNPEIELLRFKQFLLKYPLKDEEVFRPDFPKKASDIFKKMRPYFDVMSIYLTTDLDGIDLVS